MMRSLRFCAALIALWGAAACSDGSSRGVLPPTTHPLPGIATLRGTVDVAAGTLTFDPISPSVGRLSPSLGVNAAIYGNQGTTVRIYNSVVVKSAPVLGKKTYSANVGLRNLLSYAIGDEQASLLPPDTLGIFVFVNSGPTVGATSSACSPACTVTVKNAHGQLAFNAPLQSYWYWPDRLDAVNGLRDTTLVRKTWVFEADTQVTAFTFDVLVSAPWVAPIETRWKVDYEGDSLPDTQSEPRWRLRKSGNGTHSATGGVLTVNPGPSGAEISFYRRDSLAGTTSAYMEGLIRYTGVTGRTSTARLVIDDSTRFVAFGINGSQVGFIDANNAFLGTPFVMNTIAAYHTYQLRKYAADSAVFLVDGTRRGGITYGTFSTTQYLGTAPLLQFGIAGPDNSVALWDYVVYEIGTPSP